MIPSCESFPALIMVLFKNLDFETNVISDFRVDIVNEKKNYAYRNIKSLV